MDAASLEENRPDTTNMTLEKIALLRTSLNVTFVSAEIPVF